MTASFLASIAEVFFSHRAYFCGKQAIVLQSAAGTRMATSHSGSGALEKRRAQIAVPCGKYTRDFQHLPQERHVRSLTDHFLF